MKFSILVGRYRHYSQPCVSMVYCSLYFFWLVLASAFGVLSVHTCAIQCSAEYFRETFCRLPEFSGWNFFPRHSVLQALPLVVSLDSKLLLLNSGCPLGSIWIAAWTTLHCGLETSLKAVSWVNYLAHFTCFLYCWGHCLCCLMSSEMKIIILHALPGYFGCFR